MYTAKRTAARRVRFSHDKGLWGAARGSQGKDIDTYVKGIPDRRRVLVLGSTTTTRIWHRRSSRPCGSCCSCRRAAGRRCKRDRAGGVARRPIRPRPVAAGGLYSTLGGVPPSRHDGELQSQYPASDDVDFAMAELYSSPSVENFGRAARAYQEVIAVGGRIAPLKAPRRAIAPCSAFPMPDSASGVSRNRLRRSRRPSTLVSAIRPGSCRSSCCAAPTIARFSTTPLPKTTTGGFWPTRN